MVSFLFAQEAKYLNYKVSIYNVNSPSESGISVSQCGIMRCWDSCVSIPHVYENYILTFVTEGRGTYTIDGTRYEIEAGEGFLTAPNIITNWTTSGRNPWKYIFIVLSGTEVKRLLRNSGMGTKSKIFDFKLDSQIIETLHKMLEISKKPEFNSYSVLTHFYFLLNRFVTISEHSYRSNENTSHHFEAALTFIENNYMYNITVFDIAKHLNIERSYLYKIFIKQEGISPLRFLHKYRLEKAKQMMTHEDISTSTIAQAVGFYDFSHFSHKFSNEYGISPGKYRKQLLSSSKKEEP